MWSYWEQQTFIGQPDYTVIGSGIVGLSAAIVLKTEQPQSKVLIIEAGHLPSGASTKNAGFACFGSPSELLMDLVHSSPNDVFSLVKKRFDGLSLLRQTLGDENIQYEAPGSYELFRNKSDFEATYEKLTFLNDELKNTLGFAPYAIKDIEHFGFEGFQGSIQINGEGQINTGKMMRSLIQKAQSMGVEILNGLPVHEIHDEANHVQIQTDHGIIKASKCLIATNGFAKKLLPVLDVAPARAQVLITRPIQNLKIKGTFHFDEGYYYFRNVDNRILFGGGRNLDKQGEATIEIALNKDIQQHLLELLKSHILPNQAFEIEMQWTGIMAVGKHKMPIVKKISKNIGCAVRLGGMGIAIGSLIGKEGADLLMAD